MQQFTTNRNYSSLLQGIWYNRIPLIETTDRNLKMTILCLQEQVLLKQDDRVLLGSKQFLYA